MSILCMGCMAFWDKFGNDHLLMVTRYDVISSRYSSHFWVRMHVFQHFLYKTFSIGNIMICSDISHKYHERYFKIVAQFHEPSGQWNVRQFWNITSGIYAKYHVQIMLLFVYTTTRKRFVIFTCRYFKLSWDTTALSQSNCKNFSCSSIIYTNYKGLITKF